ncbi:hypothetical protein BN1708_002890 [Verticillium longisporum]|uniref:NAD(P)-binding domain-containing protein n=1 Tax=Verticillium longisporum TaxID=100787 RepID=A0A0G4L3W1_VERLO|nr:hypothetical protein BN1708_002890 [Verticillium longisporum]
MHLILTGATGLVGSGVLDAMIKMKDVTKISILARRPVAMAENAKDPRINVIIHKDFNSYSPEVLDKLRGAKGVVWALGISQNLVSKEDYVKITKDYTLAAAEAFAPLASADEPFRFIYVSGEGATHSPSRFTPIFGRVKGETEMLLSEMRAARPGFLTESVRPAGVDAGQHAAVKPYIPNPGLVYNAMWVLFAPVLLVAKSLHSPTEPLGQFLTGMAMGKYDGPLAAGGPGVQTLSGGSRVVSNVGFRRLFGL